MNHYTFISFFLKFLTSFLIFLYFLVHFFHQLENAILFKIKLQARKKICSSIHSCLSSWLCLVCYREGLFLSVYNILLNWYFSLFEKVQDWLDEMASFVKSIDKNHLLTVGLEGFYAPTYPKRLTMNPAEWASHLGSDFIRNSKLPTIDFASVHIYPDHWYLALTCITIHCSSYLLAKIW